MRYLIAAALLVTALLSLSPVLAADKEGFVSLDTRLELDREGGLLVTHKAVVQAEGDEVKRGIFIRLPRSLGDIDIVSVRRDGAEEGWKVSKKRLRIGRKRERLEPGTYTYDIVYRARRPFWLVEQDDGSQAARFVWQPVLRSSDLPWGTATLSMTWPGSITWLDDPSTGNRSWTFDGPLSSRRGPDARKIPERIEMRFATDGLPEIAIRRDIYAPRLRYLPLAGLLIVWLYLHSSWSRVGRDRRPGPIEEKSGPPTDISAPAASYVRKMGFETRAFYAALMSLVVNGHMTLTPGEKKKTFVLSRGRGQPSSPEEAALLERLFSKGDTVRVGRGEGRVTKSLFALTKALKERYEGVMFRTNQASWLWGFGLAVLLSLFVVYELIMHARGDNQDVIATIIAVAVAVVSPILALIYLALFKAPTTLGRMVMDRIEGVRLYLTREDRLRDTLATPQHFLELLPYAVALNAEKDWAARFGDTLDSVDDPQAADLIAWYREMLRQSESDDATFAAVIAPAFLSSTGAHTGGGGTSGGASAGGW